MVCEIFKLNKMPFLTNYWGHARSTQNKIQPDQSVHVCIVAIFQPLFVNNLQKPESTF